MSRWTLRLTVAAVIALSVLGLGVAAPSVSAQSNWYAEYFPNIGLAGAPALTRNEAQLNFDWGTGSPGAGIPADSFSARFTRDEWFETGTYRFSYRSDDGIRVFLDSTLIIDDWRDRQATWSIADVAVSKGTHRVRVEYYENGGGAALQVVWERITGGAGWRGEYFTNRDLAGSPTVVRYDPAIDFDWGTGTPDPAIPADNFSVRWTRPVDLTAGSYRFYTSSDDGVRIFVDGSLVVDAWAGAHMSKTRSGDINLAGGQHTVVVEYYEQGVTAAAHVWWDKLGGFSGWEGRYYDNADVRGGPILIRDDADINFSWGEGSPSAGIPADNFSVAWTRQINFTAGYYRINAQSDDGVRVWLDGALIMDYWQQQDYVLRSVDGTYLTGVHTLKVEYFERAGNARVRFWIEPSGAAPAPSPSPTPVFVLPGPWQGEYFNNRTLSGTPALVRTDQVIDFNWGWGSPATGIGKDNFSARWTGTFQFPAGRYVFSSYSDDGARLYIDGKRVINSWIAMRGFRSAWVNLAAGSHTIKLEFFERTQAARVRLYWKPFGVVLPTIALLPLPTPQTCLGGPLLIVTWPVSKTCVGGGWKTIVYAQASGGDCLYTYAWERQAKGGPMSGPITFELTSTGGAMVGEVSVASAGQTAKTKLYVAPPVCH